MTSQSEPQDGGRGLEDYQKALAEVLIMVKIAGANIESLIQLMYGKGYLNDNDLKAIQEDVLEAIRFTIPKVSGSDK